MFFKLYTLEYYRFLRTKYDEEWSGIDINRLLRPIRSSEYDLSEINKNEKFDDFVKYMFSDEVETNVRLIFLNRQPTLWKYGIPAVEIVGITDSDVIYVSNLIVESMGMDFDGDTAAVYKIHDSESILEVEKNAFLKNMIKFENNGNYIHTILNEAFYAFQILKNTKFKDEDIFTEISELKSLPYSELIDINSKYKFKNNFYTYGICLLNSWCELEEILIDNNTTQQKLSDIIYKHCNCDNTKYHQLLNDVNRKLNWFLTTYPKETLTIPFIEACDLLETSKNNNILKNLPTNPHVGYIIYDSIVDKIYKNLPKDSQLYKLTLAKFRKTQFSKSLLSIGYLANSRGEVLVSPVDGCVLGGLSEDSFFESSSGTRKALVDKIEAVPDSGYAQRT